jgi:hypothetical protein
MPIDTNLQENEFGVGLNCSLYVTKYIPKSHTKATEACGIACSMTWRIRYVFYLISVQKWKQNNLIIR